MFWIIGHSVVWALQRFTKQRYIRISRPNDNISYVKRIVYEKHQGEPMVFADPIERSYVIVHDNGVLKNYYRGEEPLKFSWKPFIPFEKQVVRRRRPKYEIGE